MALISKAAHRLHMLDHPAGKGRQVSGATGVLGCRNMRRTIDQTDERC
jgi:hypothetical protein